MYPKQKNIFYGMFLSCFFASFAHCTSDLKNPENPETQSVSKSQNPKFEKNDIQIKEPVEKVEDIIDKEALTPEGIPYDIRFKGDAEKDVLGMMEDVSTLIRLKDRLPSSFSGLGNRAKKDQKKFRDVLRSFGYFQGRVDFRISDKENKAVVKFRIETGPRYKIDDVVLNAIDNPKLLSDKKCQLTYDVLEVRPDQFVKLEKIKQAAKKMQRFLQDQGYPFAVVQKPYATINHQDKTILVTFPIQTGILAKIERTEFHGTKDVSPIFIKNRIKWNPGDLYSLGKIEMSRQRLSETQLISTIKVDVKRLDNTPVVDASGHAVPRPVVMHVNVAEAPPRSINIGLRFSTSEKMGARTFWHHNNIFGGQEHFGISYRMNSAERRLKTTYDMPDFFAPNQVWSNECILLWESNPAYKGHINTLKTHVVRPLVESLWGSLGFVFEQGRLTHDDEKRNHTIYGMPFEFRLDTTKRRLDPAQGLRVIAHVTPYMGRMHNTNRMVLLNSKGSMYIPFSRDELGAPKTMLALFCRLGTAFIDSNDNMPLNKRFYGGGAGSVRAYGIKLLGPINDNRIPIGGRSLLEVGAEARFRFTETIGGVVFIEGGTVSTDKIPSLHSKHVLWGAGLGVRYFTSFAPIRADIAFPMKRRIVNGKKMDSAFQIYISIGQAF